MAKTQTTPTDTSDVTAPVSETDTLMALQGLVERQAMRVDEIREKIKSLSESMRSIFENDNEYSSQEEYVKEASKKVKDRKANLTQSPEFRELSAKSVELKDELKELEESLNTHLLSFYQQTGVKVFDTSNGTQREFKVLAKLLPKRASSQDNDK